MTIRSRFAKSMLALVLWGGIALSVSIGAYADGIDLAKKGNNFGIVNQISMETGRVFAGRMFIVDSGHTLARDAVSSGNFKSPYATIDYAVGRAGTPNATGPNNGNLILVLSGHTETVSSAGLLDIDIAGLTIAGVGSGSDRPNINFTTVVGADMDVDAANTTLYNLLFTGGFDALTGPIDINAADCSIINCEYRDVTGQATDVFVVAQEADRLLIDGLLFRGAVADGGDSAILMVSGTASDATGGPDDVILRNFSIYGNFDTGAIENITGGLIRASIHNGFIWTEAAEDLAINLNGTSTGFIGPDISIRLQDAAASTNDSVIGSDTQFMQPIEIVTTNDGTSLKLGWSDVLGTSTSHAATTDG